MAATDSPPSYEDVIKYIQDQLPGKEASPKQVMNSVTSLPPGYADVIAEESHRYSLQLSDDELKQFGLGVAKTLSSDDGIDAAKDTAKRAADAVDAIDTVLKETLALMTEVTTIWPSGADLLPRFDGLTTRFHALIEKSRVLAAQLSFYGQKFDDEIVQFCGDNTISVSERQTKIQKYIKDVEDYSHQATLLSEDLLTFSDDFDKFVGIFQAWVSRNVDEANAQLKKLNAELTEINSKIQKLKTALVVMGAAAAAAEPITAIVAALSGPAAPLVMIGGSIFAGLALGSVVGIQLAINAAETDKEAKQTEIDQMKDKISKLEAVQKTLDKADHARMAAVHANITALCGLWNTVMDDAVKIQGWLEDGAEDAARPAYMKKALDHAVALYSTMAQYMDEYARGLPPSGSAR